MKDKAVDRPTPEEEPVQVPGTLDAVVHVRHAPVRCPRCEEGFEDARGVVACSACAAKHHDACWREGQACSVCRHDSPLRESARLTIPAPPKPRPRPADTPRGTRSRFVAVLCVVAIAGVAGLARGILGPATLLVDEPPAREIVCRTPEVDFRGELSTAILAGARVRIAGVPAEVTPRGAFSLKLCLPEGVHDLDVVASTWARSLTERRRVRVDLTPPVVDLGGEVTNTGVRVRPLDLATVVGDSIVVRGRVMDTSPTVTIRVRESITEVASGGPFELVVQLSEGLQRLVLQATDEAGNAREELVGLVQVVSTPSIPVELAPAERPNEAVNAIDGSVLVWVPGGEMRNAPDGYKPGYSVHFSRGFWMGKTEVSWGQYRRFCAATGRPRPGREAADDLPASDVTWHDAQAYCAWARLRLPSRHEWEHTIRGSSWRPDPWVPGLPALVPVNAYPEGTSPGLGCLHMADNVTEWTSDPDASGWFRHACGMSSLHPMVQQQARHVVAKDGGAEWLGFRVCTSGAPGPGEGGP